MKSKRFTLILMLTLTAVLYGESIRGPVSGILSLSEERIITTKVEYITGISINDISPLIQGLKLSVKADESMEIYRNSFAVYLYKDLDSPLTMENNSYRGTQSLMRFIPFNDDLNVLIPLSSSHTMSPDRSSVLLSDKDNSQEFPMILTILPISKGIPDSVYQKDIQIELSPVYFDKGQLNLNLLNDRGESLENEITLTIDKKTYPWPAGPFILNSGIHNLTVRTEDGGEESLVFSLEAGEVLNLDHIVQYQLPVLSIETIEGLSVYLDGRLLDAGELKTPMEIEPGSHSIRFIMGDFTVSRDFNAEMQQKISITMIPEILMEYR